MYLELAFTGMVVACLAYLWKRNSTNPPINLPPGPEPAFVLGNFKDLDMERVHKSLQEMSCKYGPVVHIRLLKKHIILLNSSDVIRKAFDSQEFREHLNDKSKGFFGTYLVYDHADVLLGPYLERTFKMKAVMLKGLQPSMTEEQLTNELTLLVERFNAHALSGKDFSPIETIETMLAEVLSILVAGDFRKGDSEMMWDFVNWSNKLLNPSVESVLKNLPFLRHFPGKLGNTYSTVKEKRDILLQRLFVESRATYKAGVNRGLVDTCLYIQDSEKEKTGESWLTDDMVKAMIIDTIGAGLVSTSSTILATVLNLLHNKQCIEKMLAEINTVLGKDRFAMPADVKRLPYSYAVVLETQRYSTIVPIVSHFCSKEDVQFEGFTIPRGAMVWGNIWSAHHEEKVWTDPWTFRPERFLDSKGSLLPEDDPARRRLIPLGVGMRYCVGKDFAMARILTYIVTIVQHFDIFPPKDTELFSCDPNLYTSGAVLQLQDFKCRSQCR